MNQFTQVLQQAADLLTGVRRPADAAAEARQLISVFGYGTADAKAKQRQAGLLSAAAKLERLFQLSAPDAPGLVFFGGEADPSLIGWPGTGHPPISVAGAGLSPVEAFESCVAEGIEYLSQFATEADVMRRDCLYHVDCDGHRAHVVATLHQVGVEADRPIDWVMARSLRNGAAAWLPADMCLRRSRKTRDFVAPFKLSTGCGAGISFDDAVLHGVCELIERDAVALWWRGGRRARGIADRSESREVGVALLAALRGEPARRTSWLLDITTDLGVPCVAACSVGADGRQFVCGHAARPSRAAAVRAAILEMCQLELGQAVIAAKLREGGEAALNIADRQHLRRAGMIDAAHCALLHPSDLLPAEDDPVMMPREILGRLADRGIELLVLDLTRPVFGVPVARVVAPMLQLEPSSITTTRLAGMIAQTGGAEAYTHGVALL